MVYTVTEVRLAKPCILTVTKDHLMESLQTIKLFGIRLQKPIMLERGTDDDIWLL